MKEMSTTATSINERDPAEITTATKLGCISDGRSGYNICVKLMKNSIDVVL